MAESFVQLPADSTGKKLRARSRVIGANTVYEQAIFAAANPSWVAYADAVAFASAKDHLTIFNASGSGVIVRVRKLFAINLNVATSTGVVVRFNVDTVTSAPTGGTTITPVSQDTTNTALPAGVTVRTNGTVTSVTTLFPFITSSEEETAAAALSKTVFQQSLNLIPEGPEIQEFTCREGQGLTVVQVGTSTVGSFGWILGFTVEA